MARYNVERTYREYDCPPCNCSPGGGGDSGMVFAIILIISAGAGWLFGAVSGSSLIGTIGFFGTAILTLLIRSYED